MVWDGKAQYGLIDLIEGFKLYYLWIHLAWTETKRRYRRTAIGPLWVSLSMLIFSLVLSVVWATLWQQSVKEFLPFLLSGLLAWTFISSCIGESTSTLISAEAVLKNRKFPYSVYTNALITKQLIIYTDASKTQLGSVISQEGKPIAFYSRKLNPAQTQYTTTKRELL